MNTLKRNKKQASYLNSRSALLFQQNIFRFHIAVNNFELAQSIQTLQQWVCKFADKLQAEALKFILFDQFVEVYVKQLKNDAHVIPKHEVIKPRKHGND